MRGFSFQIEIKSKDGLAGVGPTPLPEESALHREIFMKIWEKLQR